MAAAARACTPAQRYGSPLFGLVHDLVKNEVGIAVGIVRGQLAPEHHEAVDAVTGAADTLFVIALGMDIDLHGHAFGDHLVDGVIKPTNEV